VVVCTQQGVVPVQKIKKMDWKGIASIHMTSTRAKRLQLQYKS